LSAHILACFERVRIINLVDRPDRRREMIAELNRLEGWATNIEFFEAHRPAAAGGFPSIGARGCFESHLAILRSARDANARDVLILEDDLDFARHAGERLKSVLSELARRPWDFFYGAHVIAGDSRKGLVQLAPNEPVMTTSFVAISRRAVADLVVFLEGVLSRPPGSPDYGPMHVDGAYTVFRSLHPQYVTLTAFPPLGRQRSSPSDVTPGHMLLDRWRSTRPVAALLRRGYNLLRRHQIPRATE
jgi:glycosyl transferase, family 25